MKEFIISSKKRTSGDNNNFTITSNYPYQVFTKIKLIEAVIPVSYTNCSGTVIVDGNNSGSTSINILPDKYSLDSLKNLLQTQLTALKIGESYTVSYSTIGFFTITSTESFSLTFSSSNASSFGFEIGETSSSSSQTSSKSALNGLQIDNYINICCSNIGGIDNGTIILEQNQISNFVLCSIIPCDVGITKFRNYQESPWIKLPENKIPSNFYLTFSSGNAVNLNGGEWSLKVLLSK